MPSSSGLPVTPSCFSLAIESVFLHWPRNGHVVPLLCWISQQLTPIFIHSFIPESAFWGPCSGRVFFWSSLCDVFFVQRFTFAFLSPMSFTGRHVLVTGSAGGIGLAVAEAFLREGAKVRSRKLFSSWTMAVKHWFFSSHFFDFFLHRFCYRLNHEEVLIVLRHCRFYSNVVVCVFGAFIVLIYLPLSCTLFQLVSFVCSAFSTDIQMIFR